jgi:DNA primase catalytic core
MARFDQEFIERLKTETDIVALIESYGTKLKPRGEASGEMIGLCPIHDDKNPSLVVNRKKNVWNCLGACGCGGDVIQWVMHAEKASFRHAVELLKSDATGSAGGKKFTTERKLESPLADIAGEQEAFAQVVNYYHDRLKESPAALEYLQKRFITDHEAIERFKIGFVDRTLGLRLPAKQVKAGKEIRQRLKGIGILRDSGHEHFRGCVTFPLFSDDGQLRQLYGRRIDNGQKNSGRHFYLSRPQGGIFNVEALQASDEIILCESVIDALTFWSAGYRNVTTIYGTNGLTDEMVCALQVHDIKRILLAYDADDAGDNAAALHAQRFGQLGIECFRTRVSDGAKDINGCAFLNGGGHPEPIQEALGLLIRNAAWIGSGAKPARSSGAGAAKEKKRTSKPTDNQAAKASSLAAEIPGVEVARDEQKQPEATAEVEAAKPPKQPPAASPQPPAPKEIEAEVKENGIVIQLGNRIYRVRGLEKNLAFDVLKLNIMARRDESFYVDTFDLYAAKARAVFIREAARELGFDPEVIKRDLGKVLLKLESLQDKHIEDTLAVKDETIELTDKDKAAALELLKQPNLIERILADFDACGVVGEETNKLVGYLAATSRKLDKPLAVVIQSSSAAGKSSLMDAVLRFVPPEEQVGYSAMTGQSLFYMGGMNLQHKILSIAEEEGVAQASYALKLLQSEGQLTIASTGKDPGTGRMETQEYHVEGPVMIFLTTTAIDIDEELLNRCVVLTVDENREQTRAIHNQQRKNETLEGLLTGKRGSSVRNLHQNAQRLIRPLLVVNPFADRLDFCDDQARRRRDHMKYLAMIRSIALLHQYQRPIKSVVIDDETVQYVEVIASDIALANRLADQVLGKSIDELPPQTRRLLLELHSWIAAQCDELKVEQREYHFTRRMIRESLGWSQTALKKHLDRLLEMEFIIPHRGGGRRVEYELTYDGRGREGQPTMCGLIDVTTLPKDTTTTNPSSPPSDPSSPLGAASSPQDHPEITASSSPSKNGKPKESPALSR